MLSGDMDACRKPNCSLTRPRPAYMHFILLGVIFLPFTQALTVNIGFPLKISEIVFALYLPVHYMIGSRNKLLTPSNSLALVFFIFIFVVLLSEFFAQLDVGRSELDFRGGFYTDSMTRVIYLVFSVFVSLMLYSIVLDYGGSLVVKFWYLGLILTVGYHIYTIISIYAIGDAFLLPGIERHQMGWISWLHAPRSGTFHEGNFASLYYLASLVLAIFCRKKVIIAISIAGLFLTQSTSGFAGLVVFLLVYFFFAYGFTLRWAAVVLFALMVFIFVFIKFDVASKFDMAAGVSAGVRLNLAMTGLNIFFDNPLLGVGLGGYGYYFSDYEWHPDLSVLSAAAKQIPNNVYIELLSEVGLFGAFLYFSIWFFWVKEAWKIRRAHPEFLSFAICAAIVGIAFPTFNMLYVWCFYGISFALMKSSYSR